MPNVFQWGALGFTWPALPSCLRALPRPRDRPGPDIGDARASLVHLWLLAKRGSDHASLLSVMSVWDLCLWSSKQWSLLELLFCLCVHQRPSLLCIPKNVGFSTTKDLLCHILLWIRIAARPNVRSLSWWTSFLQNFPLQMKWKKQPSTQQGKAKRSKRHNLWHNASQKQVISQVPASSWERSTNINPHLIRTNLDTSYFDSFLFKPRLLNNVVKMLASLGEHKSQHFEKRIDRVRVSPHACALQQESNTSSILEPKWLQWQIFLQKSISVFEKYITTILIIVYAESWTHALLSRPREDDLNDWLLGRRAPSTVPGAEPWSKVMNTQIKWRRNSWRLLLF